MYLGLSIQHKVQSANASAPVRLCGRQFSGHGTLMVCTGLCCGAPTNELFCLGVGNGWLPGKYSQQYSCRVQPDRCDI